MDKRIPFSFSLESAGDVDEELEDDEEGRSQITKPELCHLIVWQVANSFRELRDPHNQNFT